MQACKNSPSNEDIDLIIADFAEFLTSEQQTALAMKYLHMATATDLNVAELKHKLFVAEPELQKSYKQPQLPYVINQIKIQVQQSNSS